MVVSKDHPMIVLSSRGRVVESALCFSLVDDLADEVEVGMRRGNPTSISLKPMAIRLWNMTSFRSGADRPDQRLIPVAQDAAPEQRLGDTTIGPGPVAQLEVGIRPVLVHRHRARGGG
jgi:hypothetical protein